jgi:hypothetical protein
MSDELAVVGAIIHDMAGMLSNISAFAGILEGRPDHPGRGEFLPVLAREARAAADALKDLQLARSLGEQRSDLEPIDLVGSLREAAGALGDAGWLAPQIGEAGQTVVRGDESVLSPLLVRVLDVTSAGNTTQAAPLEAHLAADDPYLVFDLSRVVYEGDVAADIERGRRELRPIALLRAVVDSWGGRSQILPREDRLCLEIHFAV